MKEHKISIIHIDTKKKRILVSHYPGGDSYHVPCSDRACLENLNQLLHPDRIKIKE